MQDAGACPVQCFDKVVCIADIVVVVIIVVFFRVRGNEVAKVLTDVALEFVGCCVAYLDCEAVGGLVDALLYVRREVKEREAYDAPRSYP